MSATARRPRLAVWKFTSCDGCQLSLLGLEDALLPLAERVDIAWFAEASSRLEGGRYDISLVEGSVSTPHQRELIARVRRRSRVLVTIGACATAGGIQALRNFADHEAFMRAVYAHPEYVATLDRSTPIAGHVAVDHELHGCPIDPGQLLELLEALLAGRAPRLPGHSVCEECKRHGQPCVMVARGTPCLGPVTRAGCGAICPRAARGCYGCFGPAESANTGALKAQWRALGVPERAIRHAFHGFNAWAEPFRSAGEE